MIIEGAGIPTTSSKEIEKTDEFKRAMEVLKKMDKRLEKDRGYKLDRLAIEIVAYLYMEHDINSHYPLTERILVMENDEDAIYEMLLTAKFGPEENDKTPEVGTDKG